MHSVCCAFSAFNVLCSQFAVHSGLLCNQFAVSTGHFWNQSGNECQKCWPGYFNRGRPYNRGHLCSKCAVGKIAPTRVSSPPAAHPLPLLTHCCPPAASPAAPAHLKPLFAHRSYSHCSCSHTAYTHPLLILTHCSCSHTTYTHPPLILNHCTCSPADAAFSRWRSKL